MAEEAATPQRRRVLWLAAGGAVLIVAAILAGVFGSHAANKSKEKAPASAPATVATTSVSSGQQPYTNLVKTNAITVPSTPVSLPVVTPATTTTSTAAASTPSASTSTGTAASGNPLQQALSNVLGGQTTGSTDGAVSVANMAWKQIGAAGSAICYPRDGKELTSMAQGTACTILVLLGGMTDPVYNVSKPINITTTKIIMSNPLNPGIIDAAKARRAFEVRRGGVLDLRTVQIMRGGALKSAELRVVQGGAVRVHLGGYFVASGVIFRDQRQTVQGYIAEIGDALIQRQRTFGGHILVIGGSIFLNACAFAGIRPLGQPIMNNFAVGGQILIMAGSGVSFGVYHVGANLFGISIVVGQVIAVFAGTYTWIGGGQTNATPVSASAAVGSSTFVGAGVLVMIGITAISANGPNFRAGFGTYSVAGGVMIVIGNAASGATLVGARAVAGGTWAVGAGLLRAIGVSAFSTITSDAFFGAGSTNFVGGGYHGFMGYPRYSSKTTAFNAGAGHGSWNGAGYTEEIGHPVGTFELVRYETGLANDLATGAGFLVYIEVYRLTCQIIRVMHGLGVTVWLGAGGAVFVHDLFPSARVINEIQPKGAGGGNPQVTVGLPTVLNTNFRTGDLPNAYFLFNARKARELQVAAPAIAAPKASELSKLPLIMSQVDFSDHTADANTIAEAIKTAPECENFFLDPQACGQGLMRAFEKVQDAVDQSSVDDWSILNHQDDSHIIAGCLSGGASANTEGYIINNSSTPLNLTLIGSDCQIPAPYNNLQTAFASIAELQANPKSRRQLLEGTTELANTTLLWYTASAICKTGEPCVPRRSLQTALLDYLQMSLLEMAVAPITFDHPISNNVLDEFPEVKNAIAPPTTAACGEYSVFNIYLTVTRQSSVDQITSKLSKANEGKLLSLLTDQMKEDGSKSEVCALTVDKASITTYPPLPDMPAFHPSSAGLIGPAVIVTANDDIAPSRELIVGQTAEAHLMNFVKGAHKVDVFLQKAGDVGDGPWLGSVSTFKDDGNDVLKFTAPLKEGRYYLVAKQPDSLYFALGTQAFHVVKEHVRRRRRY